MTARAAAGPGRQLRAADFANGLGEQNNPDWKTFGIDECSGNVVVPNGSIGFRWGEAGKWNLEQKAGKKAVELKLSLILDENHDEVAGIGFPYFGGAATNGFAVDDCSDVLTRKMPVKRLKLADGEEALRRPRPIALIYNIYRHTATN